LRSAIGSPTWAQPSNSYEDFAADNQPCTTQPRHDYNLEHYSITTRSTSAATRKRWLQPDLKVI